MSGKHNVKAFGLAFAVVLALGVLTASAAVAALPEFKAPGGFPVSYTTTSGASSLASSVENLSCTADSSTGEVTAAKSAAKITVKFTGCKGKFGACNSTAPLGASGEIITAALKGQPVYLKSGAKTPVGLLLEPETGTTFTTISCLSGIVKETVTGSIIGEVEAAGLNALTTSGTLIFENTGTTQQWTKVEEAAAKFELTAFGKPAAEKTEEAITFLKEIELKA